MTGKYIAAIVLTVVFAFVSHTRVSEAQENQSRPDKLRADFTMKRTLRVLSDTIESSGKLYLGGPGLLRWETLSPGKSILVLNGNRAWIHYPDLGVTKVFDLGDDPVMKQLCGHLHALTVEDFSRIAKLYEVQDLEDGTKRLIPRDGDVKKVFVGLRVKMGKGGVAKWVEMTQKGGDTTLILFENVKLNPALPPELFEKPKAY